MAVSPIFKIIKNVGFGALVVGSVIVSKRDMAPKRPLENHGYTIQMQEQMDIDAVAEKWAELCVAKGQLNFFSDEGHNLYGPYALNLKQLIAAGYVEKNGNRHDWTGKNGIDSRGALLNASQEQHLQIFKDMLFGMNESFKYNEMTDGLLLYAAVSGDEEQFFKLYNDSALADTATIENFGNLTVSELTQAMPDERLIYDLGAYAFGQRLEMRMGQSEEELRKEWDQKREELDAEMDEVLPAIPEIKVAVAPTTLAEPEVEKQKTYVQTLEDSRSPATLKVQDALTKRFSKHLDQSYTKQEALSMKMTERFWHRRGDPQTGVYFEVLDTAGTLGQRRYTLAGLSVNDLKLSGFVVKDEKSGALIWSEKSGVHVELGISYEEYQENWKEYADEARHLFADWADAHLTDVMDSFIPGIWHNVVQAYGGDNYLDAEGYNVNGKEYTLDAISITMLARFHGMKETMKFLESRDRANPVISESMKETLEAFHGSEHHYDLEIAPWRVFEGEGGEEYRTLDFRKQYAVQDMEKYDYIILLETTAYLESRYKLDARTPSGTYWGLFQIDKSYLKKHELPEYNKTNGTSYSLDDFDKKAWLQTDIIKQFHQKTSGYMAHAGLVDFLPYVMNRNQVEYEVLNPKFDVQESLVNTPEEFASAKLLEASEGKTEFGIQEGAIYSFQGNKVRVKEVGTKSIQPTLNELLKMSHLLGSGTIGKTITAQIGWNQLEGKDGNGTGSSQYAFSAANARSNRTIEEVRANEDFAVPSNLKAYESNNVHKRSMEEFRKQQAVQGRDVFDEGQYQQRVEELQNKAKKTVVHNEMGAQGSWHNRVGNMSNKEKRQHGIS